MIFGESASLSWKSTDVLRASLSSTKVVLPGCDMSPDTPGGAIIVNETGCMGSLFVGAEMVLPGTMTGAAAYTCCRLLAAAMSAVGLERPTESWAWTEFFLAIMAAVFNCCRRRLSPFLPATKALIRSHIHQSCLCFYKYQPGTL